MTEKTLENVLLPMVAIVISVIALSNDGKIQRPYLEVESVNFEFYNESKNKINDITSSEISFYKVKFNIVNHGLLPAQISNDINGDLHSYNGEWTGRGISVGPYEGSKITIFNGSPRNVESYFDDVKIEPEGWVNLFDYFRKQGEATIPARLALNMHYGKPLDRHEMYRQDDSYPIEDQRTYEVPEGLGYYYYGVFHCDVSRSGIDCKPLVTTPGKKRISY